MAQSVQSLVEMVLRESGPLTLDEILARVTALQPITSRNPRQSIQNALTNGHFCQSAGNGRYVYLPTFIRGACMRIPMETASADTGFLLVGAEVRALLWVVAAWRSGVTPTLLLERGPTFPLDPLWRGLARGSQLPLVVPATFWPWWSKQQALGADALLLRCENGEEGRYTLRALDGARLDRQAVVARNAALRAAAAEALRRSRGMHIAELAERLLARGIYHGEPAPDPLDGVLYGTNGPFVQDRGLITYRPDITPAMWRLFGARLTSGRQGPMGIMALDLDRSTGSPLEPAPTDTIQALRDQLAAIVAGRAPRQESIRPATQGFRLKVRLQWMRGVWRVIEMLDNQTLADLHLAIQRAFTWDNDHLYAFFLSGRPWDPVTEVEAPMDGSDPPYTDEVTLADLEPKPAMKFLYLFDFGDNLRHEVEVLGTFPLPAIGTYPRIVESHGDAPPQYPSWDDEE